MKPYGVQKTGKSLEGHANCAVCHPPTKSKTTKARRAGKRESKSAIDERHEDAKAKGVSAAPGGGAGEG